MPDESDAELLESFPNSSSGQYLTAIDLKERLIQSASPINFLYWPPDLFAFTSYVLSLSGAYQLVVSPPRNRHWPPDSTFFSELKDIFDEAPLASLPEATEALAECSRLALSLAANTDYRNDTKDGWLCLIRRTGLQWRNIVTKVPFPKTLASAASPCLYESPPDDLPPFLRFCWDIFYRTYLGEQDGRRPDVDTLLCNGGLDYSLDLMSEAHRVTASRQWVSAVALLSLHAIADEACIGVGLSEGKTIEVFFPDEDEIARLLKCDVEILPHSDGSSVGRKILRWTVP